LILVGYSYGGTTALDLANKLKRRGVTVDMLVTIDPATLGSNPTDMIPSAASSPFVPNNVKFAINYFETRSDRSPAATALGIDLGISGFPLIPEGTPTVVYNIFDQTTQHQDMDETWRPDAVTQIADFLINSAEPKELEKAALDAKQGKPTEFDSVERLVGQ
jgi:pimeloyl-ACP methyl ester carboxylesterase